LTNFAREASVALLLLLGCAGGGDAARRDVDALRDEVRALRQENGDLARRVDALSGRVASMAVRHANEAAPREEAPSPAAIAAPLVPPDLAVVRIEPPPEPRIAETRIIEQPPRAPRRAPPVPTTVPLAEPDPERLESIGRGGSREISAEADDELKRARRRTGASRGDALEAFVSRYPRHPSADNALVEASASHAEAGRADAACDLARRAADDYPAGDAMSEALERLAWCESRSGASDAERRLLERLVAEFPRTPAAARAGTRLATISGRNGDTSPNGPARSGP
jgi:cell division septum initiation protein DivIVA